jgi:Gamma-glutamyl cyclotransferase, AIG2-like
MRLFLYGTLLDATTLARRSGDPSLPARLTPATLRGWRRVALPDGRWPTLRRDRACVVIGAFVDATAAAARRLAAYEGDMYRLVPVVVTTPSGKTAARTWIAPGGTRRPWKG